MVIPQNMYFASFPGVKLQTRLYIFGQVHPVKFDLCVAGFRASPDGEQAITDMAIRNQKSVIMGICPKLNRF